MKNSTSNTTSSLGKLTLVEITNINTSFCEELGVKATKRFPTKPKAIEKCISNQKLFKDSLKTTNTSFKMVVKGKSTVYTLEETLLDTVLEETKEGSILGTYHKAIANTDGTISEVIAEFIKIMPVAPNTGKTIDYSYVVRRMKRLVKKGQLNLTNI